MASGARERVIDAMVDVSSTEGGRREVCGRLFDAVPRDALTDLLITEGWLIEHDRGETKTYRRKTYADLVREVAREHGLHDLTEVHVDFLLWERTPWPVSLDEDTITQALHRAFEETPNG